MIEDRFIGEYNEAADVTPVEGGKMETIDARSATESGEARPESISVPEEMGRLVLDIKHLTKAIEEAKTAKTTFKDRLDGHDAYMLLEDEIQKMNEELEEKQAKLSGMEKENGYNVIKED